MHGEDSRKKYPDSQAHLRMLSLLLVSMFVYRLTWEAILQDYGELVT